MLKSSTLRQIVWIPLLLGLPFPSAVFGAADFFNTRQFVAQQYRDFLNRQGDTDGINYWVQEIESGRQSRAQLVISFLRSAEFQSNIAPVARLYFAYFLRIPDYPGLLHWTEAFTRGTSLQEISNAFAASQEFANSYGNLSNRDFVARVYLNILGRPADSGGLDFWTRQLNSGTLSRGQLMASFSESQEYRSLIANEVDVTMTYVGLLRRSPETSGFEFWVNALDQRPVLLEFIEPFLDSQEYTARFDYDFPFNVANWTVNRLPNPFTRQNRCVLEQSEAGVSPMIFGASVQDDGSNVPFVTFAAYSSRFPADAGKTRLFVDDQEIAFSSINRFQDIRTSLLNARRFEIMGPSINIFIAKFNDNYMRVNLEDFDKALNALDACISTMN